MLQWVHIAAAELTRAADTPSSVTESNIRASMKFTEVARTLLPISRLPTSEPHITLSKGSSAVRIRVVALAGFLFSSSAALCLTRLLQAQRSHGVLDNAFLLPAVIASWTVALSSFWSDVLGSVLAPAAVRRIDGSARSLIHVKCWTSVTAISMN